MSFIRKRFPWLFRGTETPLGAHTLITGVLDVSSAAVPGKPDPDAVHAQAEELAALGANFVDVTALAARPAGQRLDSDEELKRLVPTLRRLRSDPPLPFFVTTYNSVTAARVLELEASGIYDPSGLTVDALMSRTLGDTDGALFIGHAPGGPESWARPRPLPDAIDSTGGDLASAIKRAIAGGVDRRRIVLCPGPGLGKRPDQSLTLLNGMSAFERLGQPLMASLANDIFLVDSIRAADAEWTAGTAAAAAIAVQQGAHIIRTDKVQTVAAAARFADRILELADDSED